MVLWSVAVQLARLLQCGSETPWFAGLPATARPRTRCTQRLTGVGLLHCQQNCKWRPPCDTNGTERFGGRIQRSVQNRAPCGGLHDCFLTESACTAVGDQPLCCAVVSGPTAGRHPGLVLVVGWRQCLCTIHLQTGVNDAAFGPLTNSGNFGRPPFEAVRGAPRLLPI